MPKRIAILGSTGSIGRQTLEVARELGERIQVVALSTNRNAELLFGQTREFGARHICICDEGAGIPQAAETVGWGSGERAATDGAPGARVYRGNDGLCELAAHPDVDMVVFAIFGAAGLKPLVAAIEAGKDIAFACKEALVAGGELVMNLVRKHGVAFLPVDSEHNSIWRCMRGRDAAAIRRIYLTASGGPFLGWTRDRLATVTVDMALAHPLWKMGRRITVNSATMMNKALEIIEAHHLFGFPPSKIGVAVHPEGIVHGWIELADGTVLAHASPADMKIPIRACLMYPDEPASASEREDFFSPSRLSFAPPDESVFTPLALGRRALSEDWSFAVALNAANEALVDLFLKKRIGFLGIIDGLAQASEGFHRYAGRPHTFEEIIALDAEVRDAAFSAYVGWDDAGEPGFRAAAR